MSALIALFYSRKLSLYLIPHCEQQQSSTATKIVILQIKELLPRFQKMCHSVYMRGGKGGVKLGRHWEMKEQ